MTIPFVPRPVRYRAETTPEREALLQTSENGQAIEIPLHGRNPTTVQGALRSWCHVRGYLLHYLKGPDALVCWAEKLTPLRTPPAGRKKKRG